MNLMPQSFLVQIRKRFTDLFTLILLLILSGCAAIEIPTTKAAPRASVSDHPNYLMPENEFVEAKFNVLASEFKGEYVGQYVQFEGKYLSHNEGALVYSDAIPKVYSDLMQANIGDPTPSTQGSARFVQLLWSVHDRELGRPFIEGNMGSRYKIYGYVLPANTRAKLKSRQDLYMVGMRTITVLLIKAEIL